MILISYDISNNKLRTKFMKYITKYGHRLQYSVYQIDNGPRVLKNIQAEIESDWVPKFGEDDSVMIFIMSETCKVIKCGYAKHEDEGIIII